MIRRVFLCGLAFVAVIGLYLLAAVIGALLSWPGLGQAAEDTDEDVTIFLAAGPIHYDFVLPLNEDAREAFAPLEQHGIPATHPNAEWLVIGWGAREFYTTTGGYSDVSARAIWRGITGDASVLRAEAVGGLNDGHGLPAMTMTDDQFQGLLHAIMDSFARDDQGAIVALEKAGFTAGDRFFAAEGRFHIFRTCNTWISRMIHHAGLDFGVWTPTPFAVTLSLNRFHPTLEN